MAPNCLRGISGPVNGRSNFIEDETGSQENSTSAYPLATVRSRAGMTAHATSRVVDLGRSVALTFLRTPALDEAHAELWQRGLAPDLFFMPVSRWSTGSRRSAR